MSVESEKALVTEKFIENLPFEGWSWKVFEKSCLELGFPENYADVLYPAGITEFTQEFSRKCNQEAIKKARENGLQSMKTSQKAEELIFQKIYSYHKKLKTPEGFKKFVTYALSPEMVISSGKNIFTFASDAWYEMGDNSTDFSYYTKRASFSAIYAKAALYSINDSSENLDKTRNYIKKNIDGLMKFHKLKSKILNFKGFKDFKLKRS